MKKIPQTPSLKTKTPMFCAPIGDVIWLPDHIIKASVLGRSQPVSIPWVYHEFFARSAERVFQMSDDLTKQIRPIIERAKRQIRPKIERAKRQIRPIVARAQKKIQPIVESAKKQIRPLVERAKKQIWPIVERVKANQRFLWIPVVFCYKNKENDRILNKWLLYTKKSNRNLKTLWGCLFWTCTVR